MSEDSHDAGKKCPKCGEMNVPGAKFCLYCGTPLPDTAPAEVPETPTATQTPETPPSPDNAPIPIRHKAARSAAPLAAPTEAPRPAPTDDAPMPIRQKAAPPAAPTPIKTEPEPDNGPHDIPAEDKLFAKDLPAWDLVPPQVVVRRRRSA